MVRPTADTARIGWLRPGNSVATVQFATSQIRMPYWRQRAVGQAVASGRCRLTLGITDPNRRTVATWIGYGRVSTRDETLDGQRDALTAARFVDEASGKIDQRPELDKALDHLRPGDTFVITRLSRAAGSLRQPAALSHCASGGEAARRAAWKPSRGA